MTKISVTPSDLRDLGKKLKALSSEYDEKITDIDKAIKEINSLLLWDGEDEESYMLKIEERYMDALKKIGVELSDYGDFLIKTSSAYDTIEAYYMEKELEI